MQKVRLKTLEEAQNSEDCNRLERVMNPVLWKRDGQDRKLARINKDFYREERLKKMSENIARKRGFI